MHALLTGGFLEALPPSSDNPDFSRFDRLLNYLSELELESGGEDRFHMLHRLRDSHVLLVGLGGLASWVAYNLLCCGVGRFTLVDNDNVEASNLNRSILYTEDHIGRPKVLAAADSMRRFAPRTHIRTEQLRVAGPRDLQEMARDADLTVGLADEPPWLIREWVAAAALEAGKPVVQASGSRVGPFHTGTGSACSICDWTQQMDRKPRYGELFRLQSRLPRGDSGALSALGAITSGIVGLEVVRYLLGLVPRTRNRIWEFRGDMCAGFADCPPNPRCGLCGDLESQQLATPSMRLAER
jgi:hypothetical protein